jgi:hypothetical protein
MSVIEDLRKSVDTPFFAAVGITDLAVEKARDARDRAEKARVEMARDARVRAEKARVEIDLATVQARATEEATKAFEQVKEMPALALNQSLVVAGKVAESYEEFAQRGQQLVKRVRTQQASKDLRSQAEATVALGKGAVTTARKAVDDIERSAKATITTGRHEATRLAELIGAQVSGEAKTVIAEVEEGVKHTRTAARRTTTTTRKSAARTRTAAKATGTSARKTVSKGAKATTTAAPKVGD